MKQFHFSKFGELALGCIKADCCIEIRMFQHFRHLQDPHPFAPLRPQHFSKNASDFFATSISKIVFQNFIFPAMSAMLCSILMKLLYTARLARFDLLRAIQSLASGITKWTIYCDQRLQICMWNCLPMLTWQERRTQRVLQESVYAS